MSTPLTYYSISQAQVDALLKKLSAEGGKIDGNIVSGKTPAGEMKVEYGYHPASGQLSITVLEKPLISMNSIQAHIKGELDSIAYELAKVPEAKPAAKEAVPPKAATAPPPATKPVS